MKRFELVRSFATGAKHFILPRPSRRVAPGRAAGPIVVAGMFRTANGLGQSARACVDGLRLHGHDPVAVDLSDCLNQVDCESECALSVMPQERSGTLILHVNAPETRAALNHLGLRRWHDWRIVGYWAWELTEAPQDWLPIARNLSEIWTPSEFVSNVFRKQLDLPVRTVPHFVRAPEVQVPNHTRSDELVRCLIMADGRSSFHRKNVIAGVEVFRAAFPSDSNAKLTVKLRNILEFPAFLGPLEKAVDDDERIEVISASLPSIDRWRMIHGHDIVLSPHRSEGFGLHLAEAMALGRCVMATNWSGNTEFMSSTNSVLLPYKLQPARDPYRVYNPPAGSVWADIDKVAWIEAMRQLALDPDRRARLGAKAAEDIATRLDGSAYAASLDL